MIKDNQKSLNHVQVLLDAVVTAAAYVLAWFIIVSGKVVPLRGATLEPGPYFVALIFIVPVDLKRLLSPVCTQTHPGKTGRICQYL